MVTELQSVLEENAASLVAASVDSTDEHTNSSPLMEEEDAPCSVALEADLVCSHLTLILKLRILLYWVKLFMRFQGNEFQREEDQNEIEPEAESEAKLCEEEASLLVAEPEPEPGPDFVQV